MLYTMNQRKPAEAELSLRRGTIADEIRERLADDIMVGRLAPGTRLDEPRLAERYGVSRTPVREALKQLVAIGLVENRPRKGVLVAEISPERLALMFEAMVELEADCACLAAQRMTKTEKEQLHDLHELTRLTIEEGDAQRFDYLNREFHALILTGCHNPFLSEAAFSLRTRLIPFWRLQFRSLERLEPSVEEHQTILQALLTGDGETASATMRRHLIVSNAFSAKRLAHGKED